MASDAPAVNPRLLGHVIEDLILILRVREAIYFKDLSTTVAKAHHACKITQGATTHLGCGLKSVKSHDFVLLVSFLSYFYSHFFWIPPKH